MSTVLVCDDSPLAREALRRAVAGVPGSSGCWWRGPARSAWRARQRGPELVMLDVRMPGIGGVEAARRILGAAPHAAVIMMTMAEDVDGVAQSGQRRRPRLPGQGRLAEELAMVTQASHDVAAAPGPGPPDSPRGGKACRAAHRTGDVGAARHEPRAQQLRDRQRALPLRGHRQDPRATTVPQVRRGRSGPSRRDGASAGDWCAGPFGVLTRAARSDRSLDGI